MGHVYMRGDSRCTDAQGAHHMGKGQRSVAAAEEPNVRSSPPAAAGFLGQPDPLRVPETDSKRTYEEGGAELAEEFRPSWAAQAAQATRACDKTWQAGSRHSRPPMSKEAKSDILARKLLSPRYGHPRFRRKGTPCNWQNRAASAKKGFL